VLSRVPPTTIITDGKLKKIRAFPPKNIAVPINKTPSINPAMVPKSI
jgi:hypothetical protein